MSLEYAVKYAMDGWAVFPLRPNTKVPLTQNGFKDATHDVEQVRQWWSQFPEANVGVVTGRESSLVVVDIDRKNGIDGAIAAAELDLPKTLTVRTPSGGFHAIFSLPSGVLVPRRVGVRPGLDILGEGGYFVAPGSIVNGAFYEIVRNVPIAPCPESVVSLAQRAKVRDDGKVEIDASPSARVGEGGRNEYLMRIGGKLRRIGFSADEMTAALLIINTRRCTPPLSEAEVRRVAAGLERYEPDPNATEAQEAGALATRPIHELLSANYPPPEFALDPLLVHPGLALLYGPTGVAKTFFAMALAFSVSAGRRFLKYDIAKRRTVLYVDGEMGNRALQDRARKLLKGMGLEAADLIGFHTLTRDDQAGGIIPDLNQALAQERFLAALPEGCEVVIFDNLSTLTTDPDGKDNNAWGSWDSMQRLLLQLRRRGITAIVIHHANKGGMDQAGTERRKHIMDTVISLRRHDNPDGGTPGFHEIEVHITKGRNLPPGQLDPYMATLSAPFPRTQEDDSLVWSSSELAARKKDQIEEMLSMGMPISQVVTELGCASSFAYRVKDELVKAGRINYQPRKSGRPRKGEAE